MRGIVSFLLIIIYLLFFFGTSIPYQNYIIIFLILFWVLLAITFKLVVTKKHILFFAIALYYFINSWLNNSIDFGSSIAIACVPFLYYSLIRMKPIKKDFIKMLSLPSLIILVVFLFYVIFNAFPFPSHQISRAPIYFLQTIFTQKNSSAGRIFRSTDVLSFLLISFPFLITFWNSKKIIIILFLLLVLTAIYTSKLLAIVCALIITIAYFMDTKYHKLFYLLIFLFLALYPFFINSTYFYNLLSNPIIDTILGFRGRMWLAAIDLWERNISKFLFGVGHKQVVIEEIFSTSSSYVQTSYHSGLLRLLIQNGIVFYYLSLGALIVLFKDSYRNSDTLIKKLVFALTASWVVFNISDGSLFYSFGFIMPIVLPLSILFNLEPRLARG